MANDSIYSVVRMCVVESDVKEATHNYKKTRPCVMIENGLNADAAKEKAKELRANRTEDEKTDKVTFRAVKFSKLSLINGATDATDAEVVDEKPAKNTKASKKNAETKASKKNKKNAKEVVADAPVDDVVPATDENVASPIAVTDDVDEMPIDVTEEAA